MSALGALCEFNAFLDHPLVDVFDQPGAFGNRQKPVWGQVLAVSIEHAQQNRVIFFIELLEVHNRLVNQSKPVFFQRRAHLFLVFRLFVQNFEGGGEVLVNLDPVSISDARLRAGLSGSRNQFRGVGDIGRPKTDSNAAFQLNKIVFAFEQTLGNTQPQMLGKGWNGSR